MDNIIRITAWSKDRSENPGAGATDIWSLELFGGRISFRILRNMLCPRRGRLLSTDWNLTIGQLCLQWEGLEE